MIESLDDKEVMKVSCGEIVEISVKDLSFWKLNSIFAIIYKVCLSEKGIVVSLPLNSFSKDRYKFTSVFRNELSLLSDLESKQFILFYFPLYRVIRKVNISEAPWLNLR